jgi:hypothetical protein
MRAMFRRSGLVSGRVWMSVHIFHSPPPEPALRRGDVSLCFRHTGCDGEECSHDCLGSNPLDPVDGPDGLIFESVHPDIRGVVHHWGKRMESKPRLRPRLLYGSRIRGQGR